MLSFLDVHVLKINVLSLFGVIARVARVMMLGFPETTVEILLGMFLEWLSGSKRSTSPTCKSPSRMKTSLL